MSYKPLDITYFSNAYPLVQKQVSELFDIKSKKVFVKLNVLRNELSLKAFNVLLQDFNYKISNVKAKQALITFKITDIIKNKIETNNIFCQHLFFGPKKVFKINGLTQDLTSTPENVIL